MKLSFSGAQAVGKSTLISELVKLDEFSNFVTPESPTRFLYKKFGFDFSSANVEIQLATLCMQQKNTYISGNNVILDRSVIDNFAYMLYHKEHNTFNYNSVVYEFILQESISIAKDIDYIFYIHPEFPIVDDGVRSTDSVQQKDIDTKIMEAMGVLNIPKNKVFNITGSIKDRVDMVLNIVYP